MCNYEDYLREKGFGSLGFSNGLYKNTPQKIAERKKAIETVLKTIEKYYGKEKFEQLKSEVEQKRLARLKQS